VNAVVLTIMLVFGVQEGSNEVLGTNVSGFYETNPLSLYVAITVSGNRQPKGQVRRPKRARD
jgi:hypothetical protein